MTALRDKLWDFWQDTRERWRVYVARQRQGPGWILTEGHPGTMLFNLTILAAVQRAAERVPCELTVDQSNILDFAEEWSKQRRLARVRGNAAGAWRIFCRRLAKVRGTGDAIVSIHETQPVRRIKVAISGDATGARLTLSVSNEELPLLPDGLRKG